MSEAHSADVGTLLDKYKTLHSAKSERGGEKNQQINKHTLRAEE